MRRETDVEQRKGKQRREGKDEGVSVVKHEK